MDNTPDGLENLVRYFDSTYVTGSFRRIQAPPTVDGTVPAVRMRHIAPSYSPTCGTYMMQPWLEARVLTICVKPGTGVSALWLDILIQPYGP